MTNADAHCVVARVRGMLGCAARCTHMSSYRATRAASTAGARCLLQRELRNLRAELGHAGGLRLDRGTYG
jgi:hypothetical protein